MVLIMVVASTIIYNTVRFCMLLSFRRHVLYGLPRKRSMFHVLQNGNPRPCLFDGLGSFQFSSIKKNKI